MAVFRAVTTKTNSLYQRLSLSPKKCYQQFAISNLNAQASFLRYASLSLPLRELSSATRQRRTPSPVWQQQTCILHHQATDDGDFQGPYLWRALAVAATIGGFVALKLSTSQVEAATTVNDGGAGGFRKDLPTFSRDDVAKHKTVDNKVWVTYKKGVYDITSYVPKHPGGSKIMLGAGGSIDPFWKMYAAHENPAMYALLERFRIGNVIEEDKSKSVDMADPFRNDPVRHAALRPNSVKPFNAEPPGPLLVDNFTTPNELFFVRNHLPVPKVDAKTYKLSVNMEGSRKGVSLSLKDLKSKFPKHSVPVTIQCAGNRRIEMSQAKNVRGLSWQSTAISTAVWSGARLSDVLKQAGIDIDKVDIDHIQFEGCDLDPEGAAYGASIPITLARDRKHDIILAYEMNGEDIPEDHGYPVRAVIPGVVGARQVKWLSKICLSKKESDSHWQQKDYKGFNPSVDWGDADFSQAMAIQDLPVVSTICEPEAGTVLEEGDEDVVVKGYAFSGGGRGIIRVDVSADGGKTWTTADLQDGSEQDAYRAWAWTIWEAVVPLPSNHKGKVEVICKAVDSSYNVQPERVEETSDNYTALENATSVNTVPTTNRTQVITNLTQLSTNGTKLTTNGTQLTTNGTQLTTNGTQLTTNVTQLTNNLTQLTTATIQQTNNVSDTKQLARNATDTTQHTTLETRTAPYPGVSRNAPEQDRTTTTVSDPVTIITKPKLPSMITPTQGDVLTTPDKLFSSRPYIEPQIGDSEQVHQSPGGQTVVLEELQFKCALNNAYPNWIYDISWYINDKLLSFHHTDLTAEQLYSAVLREKDWGETKTLGFYVKCEITARLNGSASEYTIPTSDNFFAGIQASKSDVSLRVGHTTTAFFKSTVPIACWKRNGVRQKCYVEFEAFGKLSGDFCAPGSTTTEPERFSRFCGPVMVSDSWNSWADMEIPTVYSKPNDRTFGEYDLKAIRHVPLPSKFTDTWEGLELTNNKISFETSSSNVPVNGNCYARNDPHMRTFDGIFYENHIEGSYILYRHKTYPYSVQLLQRGCSAGRVKPVCNYGVAIQSGSDVFVAVRSKPTFWSTTKVFKYGCFRSGIKIRTSFFTGYEITLPSGTKIRLSRGLNSVSIKTSVSDEGQVEGLCGDSNGDRRNDLRLRDSNVISSNIFSSQPTDFILSWKVREDEDLYEAVKSRNSEMIAKAAERSSPQNRVYCGCKTVGAPQPLTWRGLPFRDEFCTPYMPYVKCNMKSADVSNLFEACSSKRAENLLDLEQDDLPVLIFDADTSPASTAYQGGWTETTARAHCTNAIEGHPVYEKCQDLPEVDVNLSIDMCIKDIQLTGTTDWVYLSIESYKQECMDAVTENPKYWNPTGDKESILDRVSRVLCPDDCSGQGTCDNGMCMCNTGYIGADCGIEKGVPPSNLTIPKSGLCDTSSKPCRATRVYGASFLKSSDLICKMQEVHVNKDGIFPTSESQTTDAIFVNEYEIVCYLPTSKPKGRSSASRPWLTGYKVSVSNDRVTFGDEALILPRDSTCFDCVTNVNGLTTCDQMNTHCYIDGSCYLNEVKDPSRNCYFCDTSISKLGWTFIEIDELTCGACYLNSDRKWLVSMVFSACVMMWIIF